VLAAEYQEFLEGFKLFGVIKETGVDDEGLADFMQTYFEFPVYRDENLSFYHAFGDRKLSLLGLFNPFALVPMMRRMKNKEIDGNMVGEGIVQGGIVIFGKDGKPKYMYEEQTGYDLPVVDIVLALNAVRNE